MKERMDTFKKIGVIFAMTILFSSIRLKAAEDMVEAFKRYLANPPCFSRIIYSEVSCNNTVSRTEVGGWCGDSFFLRELTGSENLDFPISLTNRNQSTLYVGRLGDTRWQIAAYNLSISVQPNLSKPDAYTGMSDGMQAMLGAVLSLGSQHVQPGTFVWSGNKFKVKASPFAKQFGAEEFDGEIVVTDGKVARMIVNGSGTWDYKYPPNTNILAGLPSEIIYGGNDNCISKIIIKEMIPAKPSDEMKLFDPRSQIDASVTILKVLSNSVVVVKPVPNQLLTKMAKEQFISDKTNIEQSAKTTTNTRVIILSIMLLLSVGFAIFAIRSRVK